MNEHDTDDPLLDDPFSPDDPAARERAQRRLEREQKRQKREQRRQRTGSRKALGGKVRDTLSGRDGAGEAPVAPRQAQPSPPQTGVPPAQQPPATQPPSQQPMPQQPMPQQPMPQQQQQQQQPMPQQQPQAQAHPTTAQQPVSSQPAAAAPTTGTQPVAPAEPAPAAAPPTGDTPLPAGEGGDGAPPRRRLRRPNMGAIRRRRIIALVLLALAAAFVWFLLALFQPFGGDGSGKVLVTIPKGATASEIGDILDKRGVVTSSSLFQLRLKLAGKGSDIQAGSYELASGMSYGAAISELTKPASERGVTLVIPEGDSRDQISQLAKDAHVKGNYTQATVHSRLLNPASYGARGAKNLEGFLFPATYTLKAGANVNKLVAQQLTAFKREIKGVNMRYAKSKNLTTYDVLIIASMIDREVEVPKERKLVAAVIYNRLHDGEPLGIDATTRFATGNYTKPLTESQLNAPSPYNTRLNAGLPPGPIGNPGLAAIKAAAAPAKVPYRFYVVKPCGNGEHAFATTEAQFEKDAQKYQRARKAANGSPEGC